MDVEALQELVVRARGLARPRLDPGAFGGPLADLPSALGCEPLQRRVRLTGDDEANRLRSSIQLEEVEVCGHDSSERDDLTADGLGGGLRSIAGAQVADRPRDEGALPRELGRALVECPLTSHVALDGHIAHDRARGVADWRDYGLLGEEGTVLAPVDKIAHPRQAVRERGPHCVVEPGRLEAALEETRVLAHDLVAAIAGYSLEGGIDVGDPCVEIGDDDRFGHLRDGSGKPIVVGVCLRLVGDVDADATHSDATVAGRQGELYEQDGVRPILEGDHVREDLRLTPEDCLVVRGHHHGDFGRPHIGICLAIPIGPHLLAQGGEKVRVGVHVATIGVLDEGGHLGFCC